MANEPEVTAEFRPSEGPQLVYSDGRMVYFLSHENSLDPAYPTASHRDLMLMRAMLQLATDKVETAIAALRSPHA